jgi:Na+/proline symporter
VVPTAKEETRMKRAGIFLTLVSVLVFVFAGVALAAFISGNNDNNNLVEARS